METPTFVPGKLRSKSQKPKSAAAKVVSEPSHLPAPPSDSIPQTSILDSLTPAEARFLAVNNQYKKRVIEHTGALSYREQKQKFNEVLKSYPMHNDLEGE
jgi:hypothetical protein